MEGKPHWSHGNSCDFFLLGSFQPHHYLVVFRKRRAGSPPKSMDHFLTSRFLQLQFFHSWQMTLIISHWKKKGEGKLKMSWCYCRSVGSSSPHRAPHSWSSAMIGGGWAPDSLPSPRILPALVLCDSEILFQVSSHVLTPENHRPVVLSLVNPFHLFRMASNWLEEVNGPSSWFQRASTECILGGVLVLHLQTSEPLSS